MSWISAHRTRFSSAENVERRVTMYRGWTSPQRMAAAGWLYKNQYRFYLSTNGINRLFNAHGALDAYEREVLRPGDDYAALAVIENYRKGRHA